VLTDYFEKLVASKTLKKLKFEIKGGSPAMSDIIGSSYAGLLKDIITENGDPEANVEINMSVKINGGNPNFLRELYEKIRDTRSKNKPNSGLYKKAEFVTESGLYNIIQDTLISDQIEYNEDTDPLDDEIYSLLQGSILSKSNELNTALEIITKLSKDTLDPFFDDNS
jgi:hypothetical protein